MTRNKNLQNEFNETKVKLGNLGIPLFRSGLNAEIDQYNQMYFTQERVDLEKSSILEVTSLMVKKLHDMEGKLRHYEEYKLEEKLKETLGKNTILEADKKHRDIELKRIRKH
jgi:hypothetical protein